MAGFWDDFKKNVFKAVDDLTWWDNEPKKTVQAAPQQPVAVASQTSIGKAVVQEIGSTVQGKDDGYQLSAHIRKYYETTML